MYGNVLVAVSEAVTNAMIHGNKSKEAKNVTLGISLPKENSVCFTIEDEGIGFDSEAIPDPTSPENIEKPHGRGVFLMKNLADNVEFLNEGSKVKMDFNLEDTLLKEVQKDKEKENNEDAIGRCLEGDCVNGNGHYFFNNALVDFKGEFKDGYINGLGVLTRASDDGEVTAEVGLWKDDESVDTKIWKLRQIGLLEEGHSWWYSPESINHTSEYVEYDDLDSYTSGSMVTRIQLDCKNNKVRPIRLFAFDNLMPLGEPLKEASIENQDFPDDWLDIPEQSKADFFINICEATRLASEATKPD